MPETISTTTGLEDIIPFCPSRRLTGLELEFDAQGAPFHDPGSIDGWESKPDGSLRNGREYVLNPPLPAAEVEAAVKNFSETCIRAKMHIGKRGGYHIHVQLDDYTKRDATILSLIYHRYQNQINLLMGPSRRDPRHTYCSSYDTVVSRPRTEDYSEESFIQSTQETLTGLFKLSQPASDRADARLTRHRMVLNFAMMRCRNPLERSVEFRQPSPSKKFINIYGWACLAVSLVEIAKVNGVSSFLQKQPTWLNFLKLLKFAEQKIGVRNLAAWAIWRRDYLEKIPDKKKARLKLYSFLSDRPRGVYSIARALDLNMALTNELLTTEVQDGRLTVVGHKYRANYDAVAHADLEMIIDGWEKMQPVAESAAVPAPAPAAA